jgi:hypothetical protein
MSEVKVNKISPRTNCGTVTLGDSGDTFSIPAGVTLTNSGTATGFGPTGAVSWNTTAVTSSPLTAASGVGYFIDTSGGAITVNLPAGSAGAIISLADYTNTWQTNNVTITPNGSEKINGGVGSVILSTEGQSLTLLYVDSTEGWKSIQDSTSSPVGNNFVAATGGTETTCGDYKIHTFTGPGTFTVTAAGNPLGSNTVDYLVVAGGGGGGQFYGAGGGAGGFRESVPSPAAWTASPLANPGGALPVSVQGYPITVGAGGVPGVPNSPGSSGSNSVFSTITSAGGGAGGGGPGIKPGSAGGSGGGGGGNSTSTAGSGNTPPTSPSQGFPGGNGPGTTYGGGGGATIAGTAGPVSTPLGGAKGGDGAGTEINPSPSVGTPGPSGPLRYFAGGGGGQYSSARSVGGGGIGQAPNTIPDKAGLINTGGGAGGDADSGFNAGSGIVIIRYKYQ